MVPWPVSSIVLVDRLIHSHMSLHSSQLKSCCYNDYSHTDQTLIPIAKKIFDDLFCSPTRTPWSEGNGIIISADSCFGNTPTINIHRKSYLRQNYGLDSTEVQSINKDGIFRYSYGTGSGLNTVGIPRRQVSEFILIFSYFEMCILYFPFIFQPTCLSPFLWWFEDNSQKYWMFSS